MKALKKWEKIFIISSIIFIIICIITYTYRLVHYYKIEHQVTKLLTLKEAIINNNSSKTLIPTSENNYYFTGNNPNNYLSYSNRIWRIISIDQDSIKLITEDNQTTLTWGINNDYQTSYINNWLNNTNEKRGIFVNSLNDYEYYLMKKNTCIDEITADNITCNKYVEDYVGLLSVKEYLTAGGENSYLNNHTYFWTSNISNDNKVWYIFNEGGINNESKNEISYYSYGVRPTVNIKSNLEYISGKGTIDNPYIIEETPIINVGSYINYSNTMWRVIEKNDQYLKLISEEYIKKDNEDYLIEYDYQTSEYHENNHINQYLNNEYYQSLDQTNLTKCNFSIGSYGKETNYDYQKTDEKTISQYVGLPSISDFFINEKNQIWLSNNIDKIKETAFIANNNGTLFSDSITNKNYIRPVICINNLKTKTGNGSKNKPYQMEDNNETNH